MSVVNSKKLFTKILDRIKLRNAASGGTDPSIVTTGEKYTWNNKSDVVIDNTLTNAGQAADAKKVGDELAPIKELGLSVIDGAINITYIES